eukprot:CAMPEP_0184754078 /NCGR_PEP_ID=MMETSP0315-20130426/44437_1 /TAXON_ID=101924 /ORGANISM="Rhodosorus marinus, Strain UTEX LB 2760" /LENGTH=416 /DNA_ID=CAMNT_0027233481 /DNA_START=409 /DNA_END=1656 /DNA_ORIENTATION=+
MMLVIYASKGIQTQTAECIVIGEVVNINHVLVVFNKIDLVNGASLRATEQKVLKTLARTKLQVFASVRVATAPREGNTLHKESLEQKLFQLVDSIPSQSSGSEERTTVVAVDHVFPIKGQGTVLTGTVLRGAVRVGMEVEFPTMARGFVKKVKTIDPSIDQSQSPQKVKESGSVLTNWTRTSQKDSSLPHPLELSTFLRCSSEAYSPCLIIDNRSIKSMTKFQLHVGHDVVDARLTLLSKGSDDEESAKPLIEKDFLREQELEHRDDRRYFAVFELEKRVSVLLNSIAVGTKLDRDPKNNACRIAFSSVVMHSLDESWRRSLKVHTQKRREGEIDRVVNSKEAICKNLFSRENNQPAFTAMEVDVQNAAQDSTAVVRARIDGTFGKSGKVRLVASDGQFRESHVGCSVSLEYNKMT